MFKGTFGEGRFAIRRHWCYPPSPLPPFPSPPFTPPPLPWFLILSGVRVFLIFHGLQTHEIRGDLLHLYTRGACQAFDVFDNSVLDMVQVLREKKQEKQLANVRLPQQYG